MFDTFEAFKPLRHQQFNFQARRYEIWVGGQMVKYDDSSHQITVRVPESLDENSEYSIVSTNAPDLTSEIISEISFDLFLTGGDRLQLVTIPESGNEIECIGLAALKNIIGATRQVKNFTKNEPYCCNLFLQNGNLVKMTFSFNNPEKLIEFYK